MFVLKKENERTKGESVFANKASELVLTFNSSFFVLVLGTLSSAHDTPLILFCELSYICNFPCLFSGTLSQL